MIFPEVYVAVNDLKKREAGYNHLLSLYGITSIEHWHSSYVSNSGGHYSVVAKGCVEDTYPGRYWPGDSIGDHLEFALKYDGVNLSYLSQIFAVVDQDEIVTYIKSKLTGKYSRRIWFFYEFLTDNKLPIENIKNGNYIEILEPARYYTLNSGERVSRQRVVNNFLGGKMFCPIIRRTEKSTELEKVDFRGRCEEISASYSPDLLRRAHSYLYNKETKSSFEIERIQPSISRTQKFINLLEQAEHRDFCTKESLIEVQNRIVDRRFCDLDYRKNQNYIGQTVSFQREIIHYISPRPEDLSELMEGLFVSHNCMKNGGVPPVVHAAVIAYAFVFFHPFADGNGRIHRFLIHNILALHGLIPKGLMFPVSAVMLKNGADYDHSLEVFSRRLMELIDYSLDEFGQMTVRNNTTWLYRFMDMTAQVEALFNFVQQTVEYELVEELDFLALYDRTKKAIQQIIDMPDNLIDLFIKFCRQNNGVLSSKKKAAYFDFLTEEELSLMTQAVRGESSHLQN